VKCDGGEASMVESSVGRGEMPMVEFLLGG
jgi:hypothetical protein